jgi:hypothetical protein
MKASDAHLGVIPDLATHAVDGLSTTAVGMQPDLVARLGATRGHVLAFGIPWHACPEADMYLTVKLTSQASLYRRTCMAHTA